MNKILNIEKTKVLGLKLIIPPTIFEDHRGIYTETYNEKLYFESDIKNKFISDCFIISDKNVLRGIHGDNKTWKLVNCLLGRFYIVIVNCDKKSDKFGKWEPFTLSETNRKQLLVPPLHGIGHYILSNKAVYHYKQTSYYEDKQEFVFFWNDSNFNIQWPTTSPTLSNKDTPK